MNALVRAFRTVNVNDTNAIKFETLPIEAYPPDPNRVQAAPEADAMVDQLRTFGDDTPKPATVQPSAVTVRVTDATGTNVSASAVQALADQGFKASATKAAATVPVTEIHYGYGQAEEAKALLTYIPDAKLVPDVKAANAVGLVLGTSFPGTITVPSTTTTVPGAPVVTAPDTTTTTTQPPAISDPCPQ